LAPCAQFCQMSNTIAGLISKEPITLEKFGYEHYILFEEAQILINNRKKMESYLSDKNLTFTSGVYESFIVGCSGKLYTRFFRRYERPLDMSGIQAQKIFEQQNDAFLKKCHTCIANGFECESDTKHETCNKCKELGVVCLKLWPVADVKDKAAGQFSVGKEGDGYRDHPMPSLYIFDALHDERAGKNVNGVLRFRGQLFGPVRTFLAYMQSTNPEIAKKLHEAGLRLSHLRSRDKMDMTNCTALCTPMVLQALPEDNVFCVARIYPDPVYAAGKEQSFKTITGVACHKHVIFISSLLSRSLGFIEMTRPPQYFVLKVSFNIHPHCITVYEDDARDILICANHSQHLSVLAFDVSKVCVRGWRSLGGKKQPSIQVPLLQVSLLGLENAMKPVQSVHYFDGKLFLASENEVCIFELLNVSENMLEFTLLSNIEVSGVRGICVFEHTLFLSCPQENKVKVFDISSQPSLVQDHDIDDPWGVAFLKSEMKLYVTSAEKHLIYSIEIEKNVIEIFCGQNNDDFKICDGLVDSCLLLYPRCLSVLGETLFVTQGTSKQPVISYISRPFEALKTYQSNCQKFLLAMGVKIPGCPHEHKNFDFLVEALENQNKFCVEMEEENKRIFGFVGGYGSFGIFSSQYIAGKKHCLKVLQNFKPRLIDELSDICQVLIEKKNQKYDRTKRTKMLNEFAQGIIDKQRWCGATTNGGEKFWSKCRDKTGQITQANYSVTSSEVFEHDIMHLKFEDNELPIIGLKTRYHKILSNAIFAVPKNGSRKSLPELHRSLLKSQVKVMHHAGHLFGELTKQHRIRQYQKDQAGIRPVNYLVPRTLILENFVDNFCIDTPKVSPSINSFVIIHENEAHGNLQFLGKLLGCQNDKILIQRYVRSNIQKYQCVKDGTLTFTKSVLIEVVKVQIVESDNEIIVSPNIWRRVFCSNSVNINCPSSVANSFVDIVGGSENRPNYIDAVRNFQNKNNINKATGDVKKQMSDSDYKDSNPESDDNLSRFLSLHGQTTIDNSNSTKTVIKNSSKNVYENDANWAGSKRVLVQSNSKNKRRRTMISFDSTSSSDSDS
jgi:hypothetical protein